MGTAAAGTAAPASAATTYVVDQRNPRCADAGRGSAAAPFCTIGAAAAKARRHRPGPGRHLQREGHSQALGRRGRGHHLRSPSPGVTVTGQAAGFDLSSVRWVTVRGFTVAGTTSYGLRALLSSHFTLANNRVSSSAGYGVYVGNSSTFTLSGNTVTGSASYGMYLTGDAGFTVSGGEVTTSGRPASGSTRKGVSVSGCGNGLITGVTVDRNTDSGIYLASGTNAVTVKGNTAFGNARGYIRAAPGIEVRAHSGNRIEANVSYNNEDSGIQFSPGPATTSPSTTSSTTTATTASTTWTRRGSVRRQQRVPQRDAGINVEANSTGSAGAVIENNVSVDNGHQQPAHRATSGSTPRSNSGT